MTTAISRTTEVAGPAASRVIHATHGPGTVQAVVDGGRKVRVEFDSMPGIPYILPVGQLNGENGPRPAKGDVRPVEEERPRAVKALASARRAHGAPEVMQILEALRMGVVPFEGVDRYTVGRDDEISRIKELVSRGRGVMVFEGEYSAGKSLLLDISESEARRAGYVTSRIELDPHEVPPSNPMRVYREIMNRMAYPGGEDGTGLAPLIDRLVKTRGRAQLQKEQHRYLSPLLFAAMRDPEGPAWRATREYVEGRGTTHKVDIMPMLRQMGWDGPSLLALPDWRTFGQGYMYLLGGIAAWMQDAGWAGLAVFFDEAESVDSMSSQSRGFAETFLRYFAAAAVPASELPFDVDDLPRGGQPVHRALPHVYRRGQPLIGIFAFTPHPVVSQVVVEAVGRGKRLARLDHLPATQMPDLVVRIVGLYREAYPSFDPGRSSTDGLIGHVRKMARHGHISTAREVVRLTVEYLDILRHRPRNVDGALVSP